MVLLVVARAFVIQTARRHKTQRSVLATVQPGRRTQDTTRGAVEWNTAEAARGPAGGLPHVFFQDIGNFLASSGSGVVSVRGMADYVVGMRACGSMCNGVGAAFRLTL